MSDEKHHIAENEAPQQDEQVSELNTPPTKEQFFEQMHLLIERARDAGLQPLQTMAYSYFKHGMTIIEGLLDSLENADRSKKKKE